MRRLGIVVQHYNIRPDLPMLIDALAKDWTVVLFARGEDLQNIETSQEKRELPRSPRTLKNRFWKALYEICGNIPGSKQNFAFWNRRRIAQQRSWWIRLRLRVLLTLRLLFANLLPFDSFLERLDVDRSTSIDDIDTFLCMTDVYDINFLAQLLRAKETVYAYVYSWDHAGKYHKFSRRISCYLTWNEGITEDLCQLHGISQKAVHEVGSTQLAIVDEFLQNESSTPRVVPHRYVYYAGTMGYPEAVEQELAVVGWLAEELARCEPGLKLRIRPYPNAKAFAPYRKLLEHKNVEIENVKISDDAVRFCPDTLAEKYSKIRDAELLLHMGSTIGLEASYFDTPVISLALNDFDYGRSSSDPLHLRHTLAQRHLQRYLFSPAEPNVIRRMDQLSKTLRLGLEHPGQLLPYNRHLTDMTPLRPISSIAAAMTQMMLESQKVVLAE